MDDTVNKANNHMRFIKNLFVIKDGILSACLAIFAHGVTCALHRPSIAITTPNEHQNVAHVFVLNRALGL
jgi:hypothetical protein